ncbi:MAG: AAA family ATPase [Gemmatimonadales bacterium]|jgi:wobble nucleotide-excising tRNase
MIRKIVSIRNVGRFLSYGASGQVDLRRYDLIFAENGRGKTTICDIFRSLQTGDPDLVLGRATLGGTGAPEIEILLDTGLARFSAGTWNQTVADIVIFDSTFVSENVYSGDTVDLANRRNLYRLIIGKEGIGLARAIEELDTASRRKSTEIRERLLAVQAHVPKGLTVEMFLALAEDPEVNAKISSKEIELQAGKEASRIATRAALSALTFPALPPRFEALLAKTISGVATDVERQVAEQIRSHDMHDRGEAWLSEGLGYIRDNTCPFCAQGLDGVQPLLAAYATYFSEAYEQVRDEVGAAREEIDSALGDAAIEAMGRLLDQNGAAVEFWSQYCPIAAPVLVGGEGAAAKAVRALRQSAHALLDRKLTKLLEPVVLDGCIRAALTELGEVQAQVGTYNNGVATANAVIKAKKVATATTDVRLVEIALVLLRATRTRHTDSVRSACEAYVAAEAEKKALEHRKEDIRRQLDEYSRHVVERYELTINQFLREVGAGFLITGTRHGYPGGVASSSYQILINDTAVDLGDRETPLGKPSFRNTLSSGDKNTLALAFFLAQLEEDRDQAAKIVLFDDPFSGQDSFRKDWTVQRIKKCGQSCQQVLVLSHDKSFLKRVWDRLTPEANERKCLQLSRVGVRDTRIAGWDIEEGTQAGFGADRRALVEYYRTGSGAPLEVVRKIRPVLESHCMRLYPGEFTGDSLGGIIGKVRAAGPGHQLFLLLDDLDALNEYATRYHHGEDPSEATEPINDTELQSFIHRTLEITGGC